MQVGVPAPRGRGGVPCPTSRQLEQDFEKERTSCGPDGGTTTSPVHPGPSCHPSRRVPTTAAAPRTGQAEPRRDCLAPRARSTVPVGITAKTPCESFSGHGPRAAGSTENAGRTPRCQLICGGRCRAPRRPPGRRLASKCRREAKKVPQ